MEDTAATRAAQALLAEHKARARFTSLGPPEAPATISDAYDIQEKHVSLLRSAHGEGAGYKVGLTSAAMQAFCGIDHPIAGVVLASRVHRSGVTVRRADFGRIVILGSFGLDWRWIFRLSVVLMLFGAIVMFVTVREKPEDLGLSHPADDRSADEEAESAGESSAARYHSVLSNWRLYATGLSIGFQNAARYALLVWIPVHFLGPNWKSASAAIDPVWITVALPIGMALGASTNSWMSDVVFGARRYPAIISYMILAAVIAIAMGFVPHGSLLGIFGLFLCGFFVFGPASSFWALCPDIFGRRLSGTATGVLNFISYACAGLGEPLIGRFMDHTGDTSVIFPVVAALCIGSAFSALLIRR